MKGIRDFHKELTGKDFPLLAERSGYVFLRHGKYHLQFAIGLL